MTARPDEYLDRIGTIDGDDGAPTEFEDAREIEFGQTDPESDRHGEGRGKRTYSSGIKPDRNRVFLVVEDPERALTPAEDKFLRGLGELMLKSRARIGGCGCSGSPWLAFHGGSMLSRFAVLDEPPRGCMYAGFPVIVIEVEVKKK